MRGRLTPRWSRRAHRLVRSCHRGARLSAYRYTDKTVSLFSPGFLAILGFNDASGHFRGFCRNASGSFAHLDDSQQVVVGFVSRCCSGSGARWLRRPGQCAGLGLDRGAWFDAKRAALGPLEGDSLVGVPSVRDSFDGPYNIRLHLTAPREHSSHAARGEPV